MSRVVRYTALVILIITCYCYGVVSLRYNLFPIQEFRNIYQEFRDIYAELNYVSHTRLQQADDNSYQFSITKLSYYELDENGRLVIDDNRSSKDEIFYAVNDKTYDFLRKFSTSDTAIIIMDAWADSGTEFLNEKYTPVYRDSILPLVTAFSEHGFIQYAFTNENTNVGYAEDLFAELELMIEEGHISKRYHAHGDVENFERELRDNGITNLIYLGFASNMCIIGRRVGMFGMMQRGFSTYFVPESSAAVETGEGWNNGLFHEFATSLIQHNFSGTISKNSILNALSGN